MSRAIQKSSKLSTMQTEPDTYANSVDPDETTHNEPSHQTLHCLPFYFDI